MHPYVTDDDFTASDVPGPIFGTTTPALAGSPIPLRVENALPTCDQCLPCTVSPECLLYAPLVSPVTTDLPETPEFPSPGSPAAMVRILAEDVDLVMDSASDLPSLPSLLLPAPSPHVLPPEPIVAPSAGTSPDLSREGPFDASQGTSVSGATPLVLDNLPGCQYRMTSYEGTHATNADPGYGIQLHNPRLLEYVGTYDDKFIDPESVCDLIKPHVVRGDAVGIWAGTISGRRHAVVVSACLPGGPLHDSYGIVAAHGWPGHPQASAGVFLQRLHDVLMDI